MALWSPRATGKAPCDGAREDGASKADFSLSLVLVVSRSSSPRALLAPPTATHRPTGLGRRGRVSYSLMEAGSEAGSGS